MIGLRNRPAILKISKALLDELDSLIMQLRHWLDEEHDENGKHLGVTYTGAITHIVVENGIVKSVS